jgi:S-(hydroxymethyl)glutathione dehydrogenase/alcohol dehydrogenase
MRAAVMWEAGGPFEIRDVELAKPGPKEVVVAIHAAGVCASDLALTTVFGQPTPVVLGHEGAGVVRAIGSEVSRVALGDRVLVLWVPPCGHCKPCLRGDEYLCANRTSTAHARAGHAHTATHRLSIDGKPLHQGMNTATFAESALVPEHALIRIDDDVPFAVASMLGCAIPTGVGAAIRSARVKPGDSVAIIGCGAVGMSALLGAIVAGAAELIAVDPMPERRELARSFGATRTLAPDELADGARDLDVVIDAVGAPATVLSAWRAARRGGTITVVGAGPPGATVPIPAYELFHDDKRLTGSFHGGISMRRDLPMLTSLWRSGRLPIERLMSGTATLNDINEVVAAQRSGRVLRTPIIVQQ